MPAIIQSALDEYVRSLASAYTGSNAKTMIKGEREALRRSMKLMNGTWLVMTPVGIRWIQPGRNNAETSRGIKSAMAHSGWNLSAGDLASLLVDS